MSYLLDTNALSEIIKPYPNKSVLEWLEATDEGTQYISVFTIGEFQKGIALLPASRRRSEGEHWFEGIIERYKERILPFTLATARVWGILDAKLRQSGRPSPLIDSMIAATALENGLTVVTRNSDDFQAAGVGVLNVWK